MWPWILAWFPMVFLAIANGTLREVWLRKHLSELHAHQLSTLTGIVILGVYMGVVVRFLQPASSGQAWAIGLLWLGMTVAFEFGFGHYIAGHPWSRLWADYNLLAGRVWALVLVWVTVAPYLAYRWWR